MVDPTKGSKKDFSMTSQFICTSFTEMYSIRKLCVALCDPENEITIHILFIQQPWTWTKSEACIYICVPKLHQNYRACLAYMASACQCLAFFLPDTLLRAVGGGRGFQHEDFHLLVANCVWVQSVAIMTAPSFPSAERTDSATARSPPRFKASFRRPSLPKEGVIFFKVNVPFQLEIKNPRLLKFIPWSETLKDGGGNCSWVLKDSPSQGVGFL